MNKPSSRIALDRDLEDETIDKTCWLSKHEVYSSMVCNSNMLIERYEDGGIKYAQRLPNTLIHWLHREREIYDKHLEYAETYARWREIFGATFSKIQKGLKKGLGDGTGKSEYAYVLLLNRLPGGVHMLLQWLTETEATEVMCGKAKREASAARVCIDALGLQIDQIYDEWNALEETGEEGWKKLVADMKGKSYYV